MAIDVEVISKTHSMTRAIALGQTLSGLEDKELTGDRGIVKDPARWSRIKSGQHFFPQDKLNQFMDATGNEAPLLYLLHSRGYDLNKYDA